MREKPLTDLQIAKITLDAADYIEGLAANVKHPSRYVAMLKSQHTVGLRAIAKQMRIIAADEAKKKGLPYV